MSGETLEDVIEAICKAARRKWPTDALPSGVVIASADARGKFAFYALLVRWPRHAEDLSQAYFSEGVRLVCWLRDGMESDLAPHDSNSLRQTIVARGVGATVREAVTRLARKIR